MKQDKTVTGYAKAFERVLKASGFDGIEERVSVYRKRLSDMYASDDFACHDIYPTTNTSYIYAIIAMCLELKKTGMSDTEIIETINSGFEQRRNFFKRLIKAIDHLPNAFEIARKWNLSDHEKRVKDGSITYDYFNVSKDKVEYHISKCMYVEMFETYGIRSLCKIFCMTDETAYANLTRHIRFVRHPDLSDGDACHDEVIRK